MADVPRPPAGRWRAPPRTGPGHPPRADRRRHHRGDPAGGRGGRARRAGRTRSAWPSSQVRRPSGGATTGSTPTATGRSRGPTSPSSRGPCSPGSCAPRPSSRPRWPSSCRCCSGVVPGLLLLVLVASGWAYNAGLKRTAASVVPLRDRVRGAARRRGRRGPGHARRRPGGWSPRAARWGPRRTSPTSHPTSRTTSPPGCGACRTGSAPRVSARRRRAAARGCLGGARARARTVRRRPPGWVGPGPRRPCGRRGRAGRARPGSAGWPSRRSCC